MPPAPADPLAPIYAAALRADMRAAVRLLDELPLAALTAAQRSAAQALRTRFADGAVAAAEPLPVDLPPRTHAFLAAYRRYWRDALLAPEQRARHEAALLAALVALLDEPPADLDAAAEAVRIAIEAEGLHALTGVTAPLYELMLWRTSVPASYAVQLPDGQVDVAVVFLDGFVSLGWAAYATCDHAHTGGWATAEALFAVRRAYDVDSEAFRVSYLAHEARHFADYRRFPRLAQPELEYRAKLTEIAQSQAITHDLVRRFAQRAGADRAVPHAFANHWVMRHLAAALAGDPGEAPAWDAIPADALRAAARSALAASTAALVARDAATVERWLGE